jgi:hypothetical protein
MILPLSQSGGMPMQSRLQRLSQGMVIGAVFATLMMISGCNGSNSSSGPQSLSNVTISQVTSSSSTTLQSGQTLQFSASVSGSSDTSIVWSIVDASGAGHGSGDVTVGNISLTGLYTAPTILSPMTLTIYAAAAADTSISSHMSITVNPFAITVDVAPMTASVQACPLTPCPNVSIVMFTATVSNTANTDVAWWVNSIQGGDSTIGTISSSGVYTAPAAVPNPAVVTITAKSAADNTKTGTASVTIIPPHAVTVSVNPTTLSLTAGMSKDFTATVVGEADTAVTWKATCSASNCGSITYKGVDTATYATPPSVSSDLLVTITATSVVDTTQYGTAMVTVTSPVAPTLVITASSSAPVLEGNQITLTAQVMNLPSGSATPTFNWNPDPSSFCISSDESVPPTSDELDNCGDPSDGDGPGTVSMSSATQATYTAPGLIFAGPGTFLGNKCTQATAANPNQPWVYIPVQASTLVNGQPLQGHICVAVLP